MTTVFESNGFKVEFNGSNTYFASRDGECFYYGTERMAMKKTERYMKSAGH